jgi:hypothetical protein
MSNLVNTSGWVGTGVVSMARSEAFPTVMARPRPEQQLAVFGVGIATQRYGARHLA